MLTLVSVSQYLEKTPHKSYHCLTSYDKLVEQSCLHLDPSLFESQPAGWKPAVESGVTEQFINQQYKYKMLQIQ